MNPNKISACFAHLLTVIISAGRTDEPSFNTLVCGINSDRFTHLMNSPYGSIADVSTEMRIWEEVFKRDLKQAIESQRQVRKK
jgi:hypothetical protein